MTGETAWRTLNGFLHTALDNGQTTGRATVLDGKTWVCWAWQEVGPKWIALAVGDGDTDENARALAEERLADEVTKYGDWHRPGMRLSLIR